MVVSGYYQKQYTLRCNLAKQRILLSNIKQTTSQNAYILYKSLAGNQPKSG